MIVETIGLGASFLLGWMAKRLINRRMFLASLPENVYPFEPLDNYHCPECGKGWSNEATKYCECEEHFDGHFHMSCNGTAHNSKKKIGCDYKWLMLSKGKR